MADPVSTRCPTCGTTLKLKSENAVGRKVPCPKCGQPFVIRRGRESPVKEADAPEERGRLAAGSTENEDVAKPPVVMGKRRSKRARRRSQMQRRESRERRSAVGGVLSVLVWINAHIAVAVCVADSAFDFLWLIGHWNEVYQQAGLGRFAVRQVARPLFLIVTAAIVWYQGVLSRDISLRGAMALAGGAYLFFFGAIALVVGLLAESVYERPVYAIQWSVIYLGVSLLAYAAWGYGPETALQRAERLMASGRFADAMKAVDEALRDDPDDLDALELERTLRDLARFG